MNQFHFLFLNIDIYYFIQHMKRLRLFETESQYETAKGEFEYPTVSYVEDTDTVHYMEKPDPSKEYLTFEALENGTFTYMICYGDDSEGETTVYARAKLQYSFNGEDWFDWARPHETSESITVLANQKLYVRGYTQSINDFYGTIKFSSTCRFNVCGLLSSLLYGYDYADEDFIWTKQPIKRGHFSSLFINCDKLISAENLILPQELAQGCYCAMFQGCTSLTTVPELPATAITLATQCYDSMFYGCTSLTTAPELPATTLATYCYQSMFFGCTALTTAPVLPATILTIGCYNSMFKGCTALTTAPELPATTLADTCYANMFNGCTALTTAPVLPATSLYKCYGCYNNMFQGCSNLNYIKAMFTTSPSTSEYTYNWVSGVAATGTFVKNSAAPWNATGVNTGVNGVPSGWTVQTASA